MNEPPQQLQWFLDELRVVRGSSPNTISNYRRDIGRYLDWLQTQKIMRCEDARAGDVDNYLQFLSEGSKERRALSASSVSRHLSSIRSFHRWLVVQKICTANPAAEVQAPKVRQNLPKALPLSDVEALLEAAKARGDARALRDGAFVELLYGTGARVSEITDLAIDDVDMEGDFPVIRVIGKGNRERIIPVGSYAKDALEQYLSRARPVLAARGKGGAHLFLNLRGQALSRQSAWEIIQHAANAAGIEQQISPHTLRHSFATHLLEGGASVREVQELLGHASVTTTQIYTRLTPQGLQEIFLQSHPRAL